MWGGASVLVEGRITKKRKRSAWFVLTLEDVLTTQGDGSDPPTATVYVPRVTSNDAFPSYLFYVQGMIQVEGVWVATLESHTGSQPASVESKPSFSSSAHPVGVGPSFFVAQTIELLQCAPDPQAVQAVIAAMRNNHALSLSTLLPRSLYAAQETSSHERTSGAEEMIQSLVSSLNRRDDAIMSHESTISSPAAVYAMIVHNLKTGKNGVMERRAPRSRIRRMAASDLAVLHHAEVALQTSFASFVTHKRDHSYQSGQPRKETDDWCSITEQCNESSQAMSCRGPQSRHEYWVTKKVPQVTWMVHRIEEIINGSATEIRHVLDVGGGRGDLACALAQRCASLTITVVDRNASSVEAGRARVKAADQKSRLHFIVTDFEAYTSQPAPYYSQPPPPPVDLVVALHACGDLSDAALHYATHTLQCSFVICPCCYTKRYLEQSFWESHPFANAPNDRDDARTNDTDDSSTITPSRTATSHTATLSAQHSSAPSVISTLLRLAELNEHPQVSHRAAVAINTARLQRCDSGVMDANGTMPRTAYSTLGLEEFSNAYSKRNLVLVGRAVSGRAVAEK